METKELSREVENEKGSVWQPMIMWFLGVPGGLCLVLWLFFFRGK